MPKHVLVGCTGSVSARDIPALLKALEESPFKPEVKLVATDNAQHFFKKEDISVEMNTDKNLWDTWTKWTDPVLHIDLGKWADMYFIAPLDANTMGKLASGICDNLLTCVARAWDPEKPVVYAPAMNTQMWNHPITAINREMLKSFGYTEVPPIKKEMACGDIAFGGLATVPALVAAVEEVLANL